MRTLLALITGSLMLIPAAARAQTVGSFADLPLRLNLGDRVRVEAPSGERSSGRILQLSPEALVLDTSAGERRFGSDAVRLVARLGGPARNAVLIGAGLGASIGAIAACAGSEREECPDGALILGGLGAGAGLLASALNRRATTIYNAAAADSAPRAATRQAGPLDAVALHVNLGDVVRVENERGERTSGRVMRLAGDALSLETRAGEQRFAAASVRTVALREYSLRRGALIGAGLLMVAALASPNCRDNPDCQPWAAGVVGAGVGLGIGALVPHMTPVYGR